MLSKRLFWVVALVVLVTAFFSSGIDFLVDYLWMDSQGYSQLFITILTARGLLALVGFLVALPILWINLSHAMRQAGDPSRFLPAELIATPVGRILSPGLIKRTVMLISILIAGLSGFALSANWEEVMLFKNGLSFGHTDPIFGYDASFYVFTLPFLDQIQSFVWSVSMFALIGIGVIYFMRLQAGKNPETGMISLAAFPKGGRLHLALWGAFVLVVLAAGFYLDRFEEMHRAGELFTGPGYADIYGTLPMLVAKIVAALVAAGGLIFALPRGNLRLLIGFAGLFAVVWVGGNVYTSVLQRFVVAPNELEKERIYLQNNITATNKAFGLDSIVERALTKDTELTAQDIANNRPTINNIRLWDHEPLLDTFSQIQEIRTYYDFISVDNDRYMIDGELRQTMLSPRELNSESLPNRTWINERLSFTHGYGLTLGPVNRVNAQGLPVLFVKDLPPVTEKKELEITHPEIYYGELANDYVFVKTNQEEFDYPKGDQNIKTTYDGTGGVLLDSLWRRLLFSIYLRDSKLLLADDFNDETRILFNRNIVERIRKVTPFLFDDPDPYLVIHKGRLVWIFDLYTLSDRFPYSQQTENIGNYMRNPIKAVIDAKDGNVIYYLVDPDEPIAKAYAAMFPGLLRPISEMPATLRAHLRHPQSFFSVQADMFATYHMKNVETFYNKEDQWSIPAGQEPYYTVMKLPEEDKEEFILMLPFTPARKDNMAAWMVARSDGDQLGKLVVYTFPKQKLIFGPKQMAARFNQDQNVSAQITLWDSSGSNVIRGTLLVIPIETSLIYIQPIYLKAEEGRIPELKRVIVGYQDDIAWAETLDKALEKIFGSGTRAIASVPQDASSISATARISGTPAAAATGSLSQRARSHYQTLDQARRDGDWTRFGVELKALGRVIEEMNRAAK